MQIKTKMTTNLYIEKCISFILTISLIEFELDIAIISLWVNVHVPDIKTTGQRFYFQFLMRHNPSTL